MTLPYQEHNSLIATRAFLEDLANSEKFSDIPEKIKLNANYLLKHFPTRERLDSLYEGETIQDISGMSLDKKEEENPNKIVNDNQTWETPGFKWKTEVEFISKN